MKYVLVSVVMILVAAAVAAIPASAQNSSGEFNPQTQFAIGAKVQISSIYGLETTPIPSTINGRGFRYGYHNQTSRSSISNQQWNLTYLQNIPTANSSITINAQVTNDTQNGGVLWIVQSGSITYNGTMLTVTNGLGGIGKLNRILTVGNATDSNGNDYRWVLEGLTTLYGGTVIASLTGTVAQLNQSTTMTAATQPNQPVTLLRGVSLTYIATIT
jgi:hypothetical protein